MTSLHAGAFILLAALLALPFGTASASCGAEDCPLDSHGRVLRTGRFGFDVMGQYVDQDRLRIGTHRAAVGELASPEDEVRTLSRSWILSGHAALTPALSLDASLPWIDREHRHISYDDDPAGSLEVFHYKGVGDLQLTGQWTFVGERHPESPSISGSLGIKLPTGRRNVSSEGAQPEPPARPGTGSLDALFGIHLMTPVEAPRWGDESTMLPLFVGAQLRVNGRGTEDYRVGNEFQLNAGMAFPLAAGFELLSQINFKLRGKDDPGSTDALAANTGGTWLYASPGLRVSTASGVGLYGYAQLPLHQRVNRIQLVSPYHLVIGTSYTFGR